MSTTSHPCAVCQHESRMAIDQALVNGKSARSVARDFNIGTPSSGHKRVKRHLDQCMGEAFRASKAAATEASGDALVARMRELDTAVDEVIHRNRQGTPVMVDGVPMLNPDGSPVIRYADTTLLAAIREARRNTELKARLAGVMEEGDELALAEARRALETPAARKAIQELEAMMAQKGDG